MSTRIGKGDPAGAARRWCAASGRTRRGAATMRRRSRRHPGIAAVHGRTAGPGALGRQGREAGHTAARGTAAQERGERQGVQVRQLGCGVWVATSGTDPGAAYVVTAAGCECRAGSEGDPVREHRAAFRVRVGVCPLCGGAGADPGCQGHAVPGGWLVCGCPGCHAPDVAHPRPAPAAVPDRLAA